MSNKLVFLAKAALCAVFALSFAFSSYAQAKKPRPSPKKPTVAGPKVNQIDIEGLRSLIKPKGKPLLVNFWATWCDPCREEFPDLVKIDAEYKGKIDVITVSLDDLADIATVVPKFLNEVKATMPAYLLKTPDESAAITMVAKDWSGNLPMTALYTATGEMAYVRMGKFTHEKLTEEIEKVLATKPAAAAGAESVSDSAVGIPVLLLLGTDLIMPASTYTYEKGVADAKKEIANGQFKIVKYGLTGYSPPTPEFEALKKKYSLTISEGGCMVPTGFEEYASGFNRTMQAAFEKKFGSNVAQQMGMRNTLE